MNNLLPIPGANPFNRKEIGPKYLASPRGEVRGVRCRPGLSPAAVPQGSGSHTPPTPSPPPPFRIAQKHRLLRNIHVHKRSRRDQRVRAHRDLSHHHRIRPNPDPIAERRRPQPRPTAGRPNRHPLRHIAVRPNARKRTDHHGSEVPDIEARSDRCARRDIKPKPKAAMMQL